VKQLVREIPGGKSKYFWLFVQTLGGVGLLEAMVMGYFYREVFSACYILAAFFPFFYGPTFVKSNKMLCGFWPMCCLLMSTFTLLPVGKQDSVFQM
jgi:phosphatidylinositol glycan class N